MVAGPPDSDAGVSEMMPVASIVVLTHNRQQALADCLAAIIEKTACEYELLVVDNGSTDETGHFLKGLMGRKPNWMHVFTRPTNEGVCARNHALREARGEYILQVDDDVVVGSGWDKYLLTPFEDPKVGAVGQEGFWLNWAGLMAGPWKAPNFLDDRRPQPGDFADLVMGFCWAWRTDRVPAYLGQATERLPVDFPDIPRFRYDEGRFAMHWHEETDLQLQIKAVGYRIRCVPAVATHRSLKNWTAAHSNDPFVGLHLAAEHERALIEKWGNKRQELGLELDRRGLQ